jgi:predicted nucleic acid-binding protein
LVHAFDPTSEHYDKAHEFLVKNLRNRNFALSEFVLQEFYLLLRNQTVFVRPLGAPQAAAQIQELRANPYWTVLKGTTDVSEQIWSVAKTPQFPRRAIFDARIAYSLAAEGVTRFATNNLKDFGRFEVMELFNPLR